MEEILVRNMADIEQIEKTPLEDRFSVRNTYDALVAGSAIDPDAVAISFIMTGDQYEHPIQVTYRRFMESVNQAANCFHDLGVGPDDVVTYLLPNAPQTHSVLWGAEAAGIANPINPLLDAPTIRDICISAGTKVLVALGEVPGSEIWGKVEKIRDDIPTLKYILRLMGPTEEDKNIFSLDEKLQEYPGDALTFTRSIGPEDIASMYHTGGTTGTPKLAMRSHFNELANAHVMSILAGLDPSNTVMCGLPLFHVNGTIVTGLAPFWGGAQVLLLTPQGYRDPGVLPNFFKIINTYRGTFFSSVPTILSILLDTPKEDADLSCLKYAICGAAPLSVELFRRFEEYTGLKILEGYGLTESTAGASINPKDGERRVGSIGLRMPYTEMKVVITDDDGGYVRDADIGEIGVIAIRGPNVFLGYREELHNRGVWLGDGWFNTGDLGRMDGDGYFWLTGRKKEMIIRGGHNIDPLSIEEPLYGLDDIKTVAAVGRPDAHAGEVPVVYVELVPGSNMTPEDIMAYAGEHIGERAAVPKEVIIMDEIPLTPIGKIFKPALTWDAARRAYERELSALGDMAASVSVKVGEDVVHGKSAVITVTPNPGVSTDKILTKINELLTRYTVQYRVEFQ
ncbi:MAG: acyl-CoA synthetase [Deltaproteobacteria bacterium]|nr:acyl-CoA synthetase [Candidatus Zymogenaceae bacterium]